MWQPRQQRAVGFRIEIVHEMQARRRAQRVDAGHRVTGELRQRLAAQAGAAGTEKDDVGSVLCQPLAGVADLRQIAMRARQREQRQAAIGVTLAEGFERGLGAVERGFQGAVGNAVRPDVLLQRAVDGLGDRH
jgi:hypothetical protein